MANTFNDTKELVDLFGDKITKFAVWSRIYNRWLTINLPQSVDIQLLVHNRKISLQAVGNDDTKPYDEFAYPELPYVISSLTWKSVYPNTNLFLLPTDDELKCKLGRLGMAFHLGSPPTFVKNAIPSGTYAVTDSMRDLHVLGDSVIGEIADVIHAAMTEPVQPVFPNGWPELISDGLTWMYVGTHFINENSIYCKSLQNLICDGSGFKYVQEWIKDKEQIEIENIAPLVNGL